MKGQDFKQSFNFTCPKCKQLLVGAEAIRLRSRPKLTKNMQKLLRKKREDEKKLTARQQVLLDRAMQQCNVLVVKCIPCQWRKEIKLLSREVLHQRKARLRQKAEEERQAELARVSEMDETLDKQALKKLKKKERRKKAAERQAQDLQQFKRLTASPIGGVAERRAGKLMSSTPLPVQSTSPSSPSPGPSGPAKLVAAERKSTTFTTPNPTQTKSARKSDRLTPSSSGNLSGRNQTPGKEQLRKVLNQKKKTNLSANDSLLQFLNSVK